MRLSETDNIKANIEKRERVDYIEIHDRDYIHNNPTLDKLKDEFGELGSRSFDVTLYNALDGDVTCITCRIFYYLRENCVSQELKRFIKKYRKYKNASNILLKHDDTQQSPSSYYYKKKGVYMPKKPNSENVVVLQDKVLRELKKYIQYHPVFIQVVGDIEKYEVGAFEYFAQLI